MKAVCPSCERLIDVSAVKVVGSDAFVGCPRCGVESSLPITTEALPNVGESARVAPPPPLSSRKTPGPRAVVLASSSEASNVVMLRAPASAAVESASSFADANPFAVPAAFCPKCISRRDETALACRTCGLVFSNARPEDLEPPPDLAAMWSELLRDWGSESRHGSIRRLAMERDQLPALGRLYRLRLAAMPDDPIAQRGRDEVFAAASSVLMVPRSKERPQMPMWLQVAIGGVAIVVAIGAIVMILRMLAP
jgi:hypothetical protein